MEKNCNIELSRVILYINISAHGEELMKNSFNNHGMNIIAHHYFNGKKDLSRIRYSVVGASNIYSSSSALDISKQKTENQVAKTTKSNSDTSGPNSQAPTSQATYGMKSGSELLSPLKYGQSGQMLDLRNYRISPDVYAAWARGETVEVQMQQMAPERVNLFTPLLASVMQIMGGMGGNVAYSKELSQVLTGQGNGDIGQLGKAAEFVNKHGTAYDLGLGTGEHIDVVAQFRVLNQEGSRPETPDEVPIRPIQYQRPEDRKPETIETTNPPSSLDVDTAQVTIGNTYDEIARTASNGVAYFKNFKAEYNKSIGYQEYLKPLIEQFGKDFDLSEIRNKDGKVDPDKVAQVLKNLAQNPHVTTGSYSKLLNQRVGSDKKESIINIAKTFTNYNMGISANTAFNDTAKDYKVNPSVGGVYLVDGKLKRGVASGVEITAEFLRDDSGRSKMTLDSLKSGANSPILRGLDGKSPLFTREEKAQIMTGKPPITPEKMLEFFNRFEKSMDNKYNTKAVIAQKINLTKDALFGAVHQTNQLRSMIDSADMIARGVTVIDKLYEGKPLDSKETEQLQALVDIYNENNSPSISISDLKDNKKAVNLLNFAETLMKDIKGTITPEMKKNGQYGQLADDIDKVIKTDSDTGIQPLRDAIANSDNVPLDGSSSVATYQEAVTKEISDIESAIAKGATSIKVGNPPKVVPVTQYLGELKTKYKKFASDFKLPESATKSTLDKIGTATVNAGKLPSGGTPSTTLGNATQYQDGIKDQLNAMKSAIDQGKTTIKIDRGNGQIEEKPLLEYVKELESDYQNFLLDASSTQEPEAIINMANLFSQVHLQAGLKLGQDTQSVYDELRGTIGLALDADSRFDGKENQIFNNITDGRVDSDSINNKMIASVNIPALKTAFENTVNADGSAKKPPTDLFNLINANFTKFTEIQAKELITLSERLLKKAGIENVPDLTGLYETARKAGESIDQAIASTMAKAKTLDPAPISVSAKTESLNISGGNFDNVSVGTVKSEEKEPVIKSEEKEPRANALKSINSLPDSDLRNKLLKAYDSSNTSQTYSQDVLTVIFAKYKEMQPEDSKKIVSAVQGIIDRPNIDLMKVYNESIANKKSPSEALMDAMDKAKEGKPVPLLEPKKQEIYSGTQYLYSATLAINYDIETPFNFLKDTGTRMS